MKRKSSTHWQAGWVCFVGKPQTPAFQLGWVLTFWWARAVYSYALGTIEVRKRKYANTLLRRSLCLRPRGYADRCVTPTLTPTRCYADCCVFFAVSLVRPLLRLPLLPCYAATPIRCHVAVFTPIHCFEDLRYLHGYAIAAHGCVDSAVYNKS